MVLHASSRIKVIFMRLKKFRQPTRYVNFNSSYYFNLAKWAPNLIQDCEKGVSPYILKFNFTLLPHS